MISPQLELILNQAIKKANTKKHEFLTLENVLLAMLKDQKVADLLNECQVDINLLEQDLNEFIDNDENFSILTDEEIDELNESQFANDKLRDIAEQNGIKYQPEISQALQRVIQRSALHVQSSGKKSIQAVNLLIAIFSERESHAVYFLEKQDITRIKIVEKVAHGIDKSVNTDSSEDQLTNDPLKKDDKYEKALREYTTNLTKMAREEKIDPVIGRNKEINRMVQILTRRRKNNPILVGESGVGKTAIAEGLALAIVQNKVPTPLKDAEIYSLDMASLLAGTKFRGDFEERLKIVLEALKTDDEKSKKRVLFIDEIHTIIGAGSTSGGSLDASNLLKPALSKGQLRCIGSTTYDEFRKFFEKDQALTRRFQKIDVKEPSSEDTVEILKGLKEKFEDFHQVRYSDQVIENIVELSEKYINERKLPDKAIDVMDEAGAYIRTQKKDILDNEYYSVSHDDIEKIVSIMGRVPAQRVSLNEKDQLKNLERDLKLLIYGQNNAISKVSNAILLSRSGLRNENKPIASFLFTGPTGVGKTELAKQLSNILGIHFERLDMSEYMEKHSVARLIGAPPGYVGFDQGGILTEGINKHPYCVLLLDEIEKAHPDIFNILLQVMDHGVLTDSNGRNTSFKNVILIMTSNAGAKEYETGSIGLTGKGQENPVMRDQAIKNYFSPEFRNRLDSIVNFNKLNNEQIILVVKKFLMNLESQLLNKKIDIEVEDEAISWLADKGFDPKLGARPLERVINEEIKKKLAHEILFGKLSEGGKVVISLDNKKLKFGFKKIEVACST
jgi:ATP-dependent Clp protease ATP-binding subunit ClpA